MDINPKTATFMENHPDNISRDDDFKFYIHQSMRLGKSYTDWQNTISCADLLKQMMDEKTALLTQLLEEESVRKSNGNHQTDSFIKGKIAGIHSILSFIDERFSLLEESVRESRENIDNN